MKEGWEYKELGEITTSINGLWKGKKDPFVRVGVIRNANFTKDITLDFSKIEYLDVEEKQYKNRKLQKGDLIVEKSGGSEKQPVGRTVLFNSEGEFSVSNFTSILRINNQNEITPEFLYKYLLYIYKEGKTKEMQKATTGIHNIIYDKFLAILIPILSLAEQQQIVSFLDSEFEKIDALKANAETQLQAAKDLFQKALKEMLTPKDGWEEKKLGEICDFRSGFAFKSSLFTESGEPIIRISDIQNGEIEDSKVVYFNLNSYKENLNKFKVYPNDILIAMSGATTGKVGINKTDKVFYLNQRVGVFRENTKILEHKYLYYFLNNKAAESLKLAIGAAQPNLSTEQINNFIVPIPSLTKQQAIADNLDTLSAKVKQLQENYNETITLCNDLKQALLKKVFE